MFKKFVLTLSLSLPLTLSAGRLSNVPTQELFTELSDRFQSAFCEANECLSGRFCTCQQNPTFTALRTMYFVGCLNGQFKEPLQMILEVKKGLEEASARG